MAMITAMERWKPVVGYEGMYEVSDLGRVRSLARKSKRGNHFLTINETILKPYRIPPGNYLSVSLSKNGVLERFRIHRLVLAAFHGPCPNGMVGCHNNGIIDDLRASNLRWDTKSANALDSVAHGTNYSAKKTECLRGHKFTDENTYVNPTSKGRQCRECIRQARRKNSVDSS